MIDYKYAKFIKRHYKRKGNYMSTQMLILTSISIYMLGMLVIGYFAYNRTSNLTDYMLGGRTLGPAVTA